VPRVAQCRTVLAASAAARSRRRHDSPRGVGETHFALRQEPASAHHEVRCGRRRQGLAKSLRSELCVELREVGALILGLFAEWLAPYGRLCLLPGRGCIVGRAYGFFLGDDRPGHALASVRGHRIRKTEWLRPRIRHVITAPTLRGRFPLMRSAGINRNPSAGRMVTPRHGEHIISALRSKRRPLGAAVRGGENNGLSST